MPSHGGGKRTLQKGCFEVGRRSVFFAGVGGTGSGHTALWQREGDAKWWSFLNHCRVRFMPARNKQSSMSNLEKPTHAVPERKKSSKGRAEMRGATARGINFILQSNANLSLPVITEIYISTAAATGNVRELRRLAGLPGANVNGRDARGRTACHIAIEEGQLESLQCLAELGADVNAPEEHGATPVSVRRGGGGGGALRRSRLSVGRSMKMPHGRATRACACPHPSPARRQHWVLALTPLASWPPRAVTPSLPPLPL